MSGAQWGRCLEHMHLLLADDDIGGRSRLLVVAVISILIACGALRPGPVTLSLCLSVAVPHAARRTQHTARSTRHNSKKEKLILTRDLRPRQGRQANPMRRRLLDPSPD